MFRIHTPYFLSRIIHQVKRLLKKLRQTIIALPRRQLIVIVSSLVIVISAFFVSAIGENQDLPIATDDYQYVESADGKGRVVSVDSENNSGAETELPNDSNRAIQSNLLLTGEALKQDANTDVHIRLIVSASHKFEKIWANYSDKSGELNKKAGSTPEPSRLTDSSAQKIHTVTIPGSKIKPGVTYYYQAVGQTFDGETYYGKIVSFEAK